MYSGLPAFNEMLAEYGWTRAYARLSDVGLGTYAGYMALYMVLVEFGVYWMHRGLHEIPWAYKHIHATHHKYNKENTLSPFAGLAFHPLDGVLQVGCCCLGGVVVLEGCLMMGAPDCLWHCMWHCMFVVTHAL